MELDAPQVDDPGETRRIVDHHLFGRSSGRKREDRRAEPGGSFLRRALLIKRLPLGAIDEALEHDRSIPNTAERALRDREVVADEFDLRELRLFREVSSRSKACAGA